MAGWGRIYNNANYFMQGHASRLAELQEQMASGARINRPADAPADAFRIMKLHAQIQSFQTYDKNLEEVVRNAELSQSILQEVSSGITQVKQSLSQVISGNYGSDSRASIAEQVDAVLEQMLAQANTQSLGRHIFGGTNSSEAPYAAERTAGRISTVDYQGSLHDILVAVAPGVEYSGLAIGDHVFRADDRQVPTFLGSTGAAAGTATSNVRGDLCLAVTHNETTYPGGTGISAGARSADGDTILGDHVLTVTVNGPEKTISLDGGDAVAFAGTETDLAVANVAGDVVYVNVAGWAGFEGNIDITATGRLSIDEGASFTELTSFADNVAVTDSRTGRVLYVNATDLLRTGAEPVRVAGTHDLFGTLIHLRDVLLNERGLTDDEQRELMGYGLESLDEVAGVVTKGMTTIGGRLQAMDILKESLQAIEDSASKQAAELQDADVVQLATDLARAQTLYEMTLTVTAKLLDLTLLDFI